LATSKNNSKSKAPAKPPAKGKAKDAPKAKVAAKPAPKPAAKPAPKQASKPVSKPVLKPAAKLPIKPAPKSTAKPAAKVDPKASAKPAAKVPAKLESKVPAKPAPATKAAKSAGDKPEAPKAAPPAGKKVPEPKSAVGKGKAGSEAKPAPPKAPASKKGPIDFTTAKSVAAAAVVATPDAQGYVMINGRRVRVLSAAAVPTKRKAASSSPAAEEKSEPPISSIKTKLSAKDLEDYKQRLLQKRRQVFGMITGMEDEALRSSGGNLSNMPLHMADIGTDTYDQDFTLGMAESERGLMQEIDEALRRIQDRTYGVCQLSGQQIPKTRLDAKPWAKYTVESARRIESGQAR
jgi:RNA polymerase-binding transcription factor DksA